MLDIQFIRENPEKVKEGVVAKGYKTDLVDTVIGLDGRWKNLLQEVEDLRAERNRAAKEKDLEKGREIKKQLQEKEPKLREIEIELREALYQIPNLPLEGVPIGKKEEYEVLREEGKISEFNFTPKDHVKIGENLDIIDIPRAAKVSGTRFTYLKNEGALLEFALVQYAMESLVKEGFTPVVPPALIRKVTTEGLGYWHGRIDEQHTANENYYLVYDPKEDEPEENPGMYLIGTGEHALVPMHADEILQERELPKRYVAFSPCFRREVGSYGQDVRGMLRVHQFDKVEMVAFVKPEEDEKVRREMLGYVEKLMADLGLPYRVVKLASEDLALPTAETVDIETWIPSQNKYRETHSISTTTDFQSRRLNIRYQAKGRIEYVNILNGTAFAIGRTIIAILENFQQKDGSVVIPEALRPYMGKDKITPK